MAGDRSRLEAHVSNLVEGVCPIEPDEDDESYDERHASAVRTVKRILSR